MACYNKNIVNLSKKIVNVISFLILLFGLITLIVGFIQMGKIDVPDDIISKIPGFPSVAAASLGKFVIILGIIIMTIGCCGFATTYFNKPFFAIPFASSTAVIGLVTFIIGIVMVGFADNLVDQIQSEVCEVADAKFNLRPSEIYNQYISDKMCTEVCPCNPGEDDFNKKAWQNMKEGHFNKFGRTFKSGEKNSIVWADEEGEGVNNFYQCIAILEEDKDFKKDKINFDKFEDFISGGLFELATYTENKLQCSGVCEPGLFSITKDIARGPAFEDCLDASIDKIQDMSKPAGAVSMIVGLALVCAFACSFPLCCKKCQSEQEDDDVKETELEGKDNKEFSDVKDAKIEQNNQV